MNLFTIRPGVPFLDALARWWLARSDDPVRRADGLFLMPTRRAARSLAEAFLRVADGEALLLPRIAALGAVDEASLALSGALTVPPAVPEARRLAALTRLVLALDGRYGAPVSADRAWLLAAELARLLDEANREGVALGRVLPGLVGEDFARHWADTLHFLQIVTARWPDWLAEAGQVDASARAVQLLQAQAAAWEVAAPPYPVVMAGMAGGSRATAALMRVVARMPQGRVVLPGVDLAMDDGAWEALEEGHPQAGLRWLLAEVGAVRGDVAGFDDASHAGEGPGRAGLVWRAMLPAAALGAWRAPFVPDMAGLERLEAADQQEEAVAIALELRAALERPGAQAALVTPDRVLAVRVAAELARFGVVVDDSAGEPLSETPPGVFLRLLVQAVVAGLSPVALLGVLKHPLAGFGLPLAEMRTRARLLERLVLRGPAPPPGIAGLRAAVAALADRTAALDEFLDRIEARLAPVLALAGLARPEAALRALIAAGEAAAETDARGGAARLWELEEGEALSQHLAGLLDALPLLPPQDVAALPGLLDASLEGAVVRSRRALRGRTGEQHPRVAILGLLEARLQSFDLLVLGGLAEDVWPAAADPGPWMSRPMRRAAGLASPEVRVGEMAHDFAMLACAAPRVVLSCPRRRDGAPTVPARWLVRLEAFLAGHGTRLPRSPAAAWARLLDQPDGPPCPVRPPEPRPPVAARPRRLSVTEVETWLRDPYGIYAKHVLRLRALDELEEAAENSDFGSVVHAAIAAWVTALPATYPADAATRLRAELDRVLAAQVVRPALIAWWRPRLARIADWVAAEEAGRRRASPNAVRAVEVDGAWPFQAPAGEFVLRGRADRIETKPDGSLALLDYKTGTLPTRADVGMGYAAQLPLEGAMVAAGGFGAALAGVAGELTYWRLTGGYVPGETGSAVGEKVPVEDAVANAGAAFMRLVARYDSAEQAYLSQPSPAAAPRFTDYAQLARVAEWAAGDEE